MSAAKKMWTAIAVIVLVILVGLAIYSFTNKGGPQTVNTAPVATVVGASENKLIAEGQFPGNTVYISLLSLKQGGFANVYTDAKGAPGTLIGSQYFAAGTNPGTVNLSQPTLAGQSYFVAVYGDNAGLRFLTRSRTRDSTTIAESLWSRK